LIFGPNNDLVTPRLFIENDQIDRKAQIWENRLPCALTPLQAQLAPGQSVQLISLAGFSPNEEMLADFLPVFKTEKDVQKASVDSKELLDDVLLPAFTVSGQPLVDAYSKQNYLDNVLRGFFHQSRGKHPYIFIHEGMAILSAITISLSCRRIRCPAGSATTEIFARIADAITGSIHSFGIRRSACSPNSCRPMVIIRSVLRVTTGSFQMTRRLRPCVRLKTMGQKGNSVTFFTRNFIRASFCTG
jgi:hypothetical protein